MNKRLFGILIFCVALSISQLNFAILDVNSFDETANVAAPHIKILRETLGEDSSVFRVCYQSDLSDCKELGDAFLAVAELRKQQVKDEKEQVESRAYINKLTRLLEEATEPMAKKLLQDKLRVEQSKFETFLQSKKSYKEVYVDDIPILNNTIMRLLEAVPLEDINEEAKRINAILDGKQ